MRFRHLVTIQKKKEVDPFSEQPASWEDVRQEWFALEPLSGEEKDRADQTQSLVTHKAKCHWFDGAASGLRVVYGERVLNVKSVVNEREQNRFLLWQLIEKT